MALRLSRHFASPTIGRRWALAPKVAIGNARDREAGMRFCRFHPCKPFPLVRIAFIAALTLLISGWSTCTAMVDFHSCEGAMPQPQIAALSPGAIPGDSSSVVLIVNGSDFVPQSQIMWNGNALQTTFMDSHHLQTTITRETFDSFGGGSSVRISVSQGSGCSLALTHNRPTVCKIDHSCASVLGHYLRHEKRTQPKTDTRYPLSDLWCCSRGEV